MEAEALKERFSPEGLRRLRGKLEGLQGSLVSAAEREAGRREGQGTVGQTLVLGGCLGRLREAQEEEEGEKEAEDGAPEEDTQESRLLSLLEKGLKLIERIELLREREAQKKKRKKALGQRLEAAKQDGSGGKNKTVPPRQSGDLTDGPPEEQHQPQHLDPPLAPEEEAREASVPWKSNGRLGGEGEDQGLAPEEEGREASGPWKSKIVAANGRLSEEGEDQDLAPVKRGRKASGPWKSKAVAANGRLGGEGEDQDLAPVKKGREASGPRRSKVVVANRQLGGEGEDHSNDEGDKESRDGQVLLNLLEKSPVHIDSFKLLRERNSERKKRKKKPQRPPRLVAAKQDGRGGNNKTVPPRQSEGLTGGPQEEQHQPQHLDPPLAPEEEGRETSGPWKSNGRLGGEGEDQDLAPVEKGREASGSSRKKRSFSNSTSGPWKSKVMVANGWLGGEGEVQDMAPMEKAREASGPWRSKVVVANRQLGGEGEDQDHSNNEGDKDIRDGQVLLNLLEKSSVHIDSFKLLRERNSKRKKKPQRPLRLVAAKKDGSGGKNKTVPPRQSEGLTGGSQEEQQHQPQHLHPPLAPEEEAREASVPWKSNGRLGGEGEDLDLAPEEKGREASGSRRSKDVVANRQLGGEGEDQDHSNDEGDKESRDGQVLLNLLEKSPVHIDSFKLLRERNSKRKKKPQRPLRLVAAKKDGSGGKNKTVPPRQSEGLIGGPQEEQQHQPQHLHPPLAPEEEAREASVPWKSNGQLGGEGEDQGLAPEEEGREASGPWKSKIVAANGRLSEEGEDQDLAPVKRGRKASGPWKSKAVAANGRLGGEGEDQDLAPVKKGREASGPRRSKVVVANRQLGGEGEDHSNDEGDKESRDGQVLLNLLEKSPVHIDSFKLLRERNSERKKRKKRKKKPQRPPRLVAAKQDGRGGNNKTVPPRQSEGLTGGPQEEQHQPQHLDPPLAPEEEAREASVPWKSNGRLGGEGEDLDLAPVEKGRETSGPRRSKEVAANRQLGGEGEDQDHSNDEGDKESRDGQVLLNLLEKSPVHIDRFKLLRERNSERKKKPQRPPRLVAAKKDGRGGNNKVVPPRQSECLIVGSQEEKQQPQHPPLAAEETRAHEEYREASDPWKSEAVDQQPDAERENQDCVNDKDDKDRGGGNTHEGGSECSDRYIYDGDNDRSARCCALWTKMDRLEQKVDKMQDISQDKVDILKEKLDCLKYAFFQVKCEKSHALEKEMICLWPALWNNLLQALTALQKALKRFLPEEMLPFEKESNSLRGFPQANWNSDTVETLSDFQRWVNSFQNTLQDYPLLKMAPSCGVPLKEMDTIKRGMGILYSTTLLHILLKQGQEKVGNLQEKVNALQNISLKQVDILKVKIGAVQKQMGALWKVPLKKVMVLPVMVNKLSSVLLFGSSEEVNTLLKKARDYIFSLKVHMWDAPQNEVDSLWQKLVALEGVLRDIPIKKLGVLAEKEKVLCGKVDALQENLWNSLQAELKFLRKKLAFLCHAPDRDLDELQEMLDGLRDYPVYPLQESVGALQKKVRALQRKTCALQKKMGVLGKVMGTLGKKMSTLQKKVSMLEKLSALQKAGAPLEDDKVMDVDRTGFSERWNTQDTAGTNQVNAAAGKITDQPSSAVAEMAILSSLGATNVKTISPDNDSIAARKKLVAYARQIEEDVNELANSKTEYHRLVMEKLRAIHKNLDQNLISPLPSQGITGNDQSTLQASQTQPYVVPPVAATRGQVQPLILPSHAPLSATRKRPSLGVEMAENPGVALQISEPSSPSGSKRQNPQQPEEATCAESSEDTLANYKGTVAKIGGSEPPQKKQKMDTVDRTQVVPVAQELYAAHQKYVRYVTVTINRNMEKVGDLMNRLQEAPNQATALKTTQDAKDLTSILKKALALLKCYLEDS